MDFTENLLRTLAIEILGTTTVPYQGMKYDFSKPFARMTVFESILHFNKEIKAQDIETLSNARQTAQKLGIPIQDDYGLGKIQIEIFENEPLKKIYSTQLLLPLILLKFLH